jgi:oligopeptide transport system substrate-binding protein
MLTMGAKWVGKLSQVTVLSAARAVSILCLSVLASACSPSDRDPATRQAGPPSTTLRRGLGADPATLDPQLADDNAAIAVAADLYEGMTTEALDGSIIPGAAQSWAIADGGLAYVFSLRPGLRWSNGDPLTAGHFVAGLRFALAPGSVAPSAGLLEAIESVDAIDPLTVRIRLSRPVPYLPALLALPVAAPIHPRAADLQPRPGNGAYRLVRRVPGERIELERNPHYRDAAHVAIERVAHLPITDLATELNLYRAGDLDLTSEVPNTQLESLRREHSAELRIAPYLSTYAYAVNLARLADAGARQALAMAVDRERVTRQITGAGERPAFGWVPDGIRGYAAARFEWQDLPYRQAATRARELWHEASAAGRAPTRIKLCTDASANHHRTAVALADLWRTALGVDTEIVELEWNVYLDTRHNPRDCDLVRLGWSADFMDPEAFADVFESGNPQNTLGYSSAAYDGLLAKSRTATDSARRMELLYRAEQQLLSDVPVVPVFFRVSKRLVKPYVEGYQANPLGHVASRDLRLNDRR